jgi:hypothetical protein
MKIAIKILPRNKPLRLLFCFGGGILLAFILSIFSHYRYWYSTIKSVQATKLHILAETVPTNLSLLLINQDQKRIQQLLNSTDGYIGLIVTNCQIIEPNCPQEKVLYQTTIDRGWQQNWQSDNLYKYPFGILTNPPSVTKINDNFNNLKSEQILGRVYYINLSPPTFIKEFETWFINLIQLKKQGLLNANTALFLFTFLSSLIVYKFLEIEINKIESIAKLRHKQLEIKIQELQKSNQGLIDEKEQINNDFTKLNQQIIDLKGKTNNFKAEIKNKEKKLHQQEQKIIKTQNILTYYEKELARIKKIKLINEEEKEYLELKIKQQQLCLQEQELELNNYLQELQTTNQELTLNQYKEEEILRLLRTREKEKAKLEKNLKQKEQELDLKEQEIRQLEQQQEKYQSWQEIAQQLEQDLQELELLREKINSLELENNNLSQTNNTLEITNKQLQISFLELQKQYRQNLNKPLIYTEKFEKKWELLCTEKFIDFWYSLNEEDKIKTSIYLDYLQQKGVTLKYPYSSNIKGSCYRELIPISHANEAIRIFYRFTPLRLPILLCGGDKDGCNPEKWYKKYVSIADDEYQKYMQNQEAFSFTELWNEMDIIARQEAIAKFMKI